LGKTIVFVTHDIDEAIKLGTMVAVLRTGGKLAQFAPPAELLSDPADAFVEDFLGADRGIRRLSFFSSAGLDLKTSPIVAVDSTAEQIAERTTPDVPYLLVTDLDGKPLGWSEPGALTAGAVDTAQLLPYGRPFEAGQDSLRAALDGAVLSPTGWAVGVDGTGRVVGVVSQGAVGEAIRSAHAAGRSGTKVAG
jgi:osmoprotectant transport system ATP-binding protein